MQDSQEDRRGSTLRTAGGIREERGFLPFCTRGEEGKGADAEVW